MGVQGQETLGTEETGHIHRAQEKQLKHYKLRKSQRRGAGVFDDLEETQKRDQESRQSSV